VPGGAGSARWLWLIACGLLAFRLLTLASYPLMDTSEARYGEIARIMLQTGNWVSPQETPGTPFWAKPPLSTWLSAGAIAIFGVNEFALRLPALLCAAGTLAWTFLWARSLTPAGAARRAWLAVALLSTSAGFFAAAGTVMTDPSLMLCTTAMLLAFHRAAIQGSPAPAWRYGFFIAAGLAMLAKGPVIALYVGAPIALWALWERRIGATWRALPWLRGSLLAALVCVPWYALAEARTPGFLSYFLLGEHLGRFLVPGWSGDRYGTAHAEPLGTIWFYCACALGPNLVLFAAAAWSGLRGAVGRTAPPLGPERRFLVLAALLPLAVFTFAGNIIWTYVLPALVPLSVLCADRLAAVFAADAGPGAGAARRGVLAVLLACATVLVLASLLWVPRHASAHSSASLLPAWQQRAHPGADALFYLGRRIPASLRFYSRGSVHAVPDLSQALDGLAPGHDRYVALAPADVPAAQRAIAQLAPAARVEQVAANKDLVLLRVAEGAAQQHGGA
jgi:4-amino-4-deoxy-L-arabinose transferase-like glycosyltransferase